MLPTLVALLVMSALLSLGFWQIERGDEKASIEAAYAERMQAAALDLGRSVPEPGNSVYRRARARGIYHPLLTFLVDNRVLNGQVGYQVVTPLQLSTTGQWVLIDRGWTPLGESRARLPDVTAPAGDLVVEGYLARPQEPPLKLGEPAPLRADAVQVVQWVDAGRIEALLGRDVFPLVLRQQGGHDPDLVKDWAVINMSPERHYAYAFQWFALAAALLVIYLVVNLRKTKPRD